MPKPRWKIDGFDKIEFKVKKGYRERFKSFAFSKGRTQQDDLEEYVNQCLEK